jgi:tRNA pseudouridine55 synthase
VSAAGPAGLVVVDKPGGLTSHDVVSRVRRLAGTRKVGHAGTLDPMATGVLLVGVNRATRLLGHLMLTRKSYDATIRLGVATATDDAEGDEVARRDTGQVTEDEVRAGCRTFVGEIAQVPSSVSAVKVEGRRAYDRVRAGEDVALEPRQVTVHALDVHAVRRLGDVCDVDVSVSCSSGTYIRALARDLGEMLGVGGHLTALRRTAVGPFTLEDASTLDDLGERFTMLGMDEVAGRCFPAYTVDEEGADAVRHGRRLAAELGPSGPVAVFDPQGTFLALYEQRGPTAAAVAVFTG